MTLADAATRFADRYPRGWVAAKALAGPVVGPLLLGPWPTPEPTWEIVAYWLLSIPLWSAVLILVLQT
ncbi:MAG: hypothetical protein ACNS61_16195 [Candidatus Wenzhouxiangella sp. M2_3B_020]